MSEYTFVILGATGDLTKRKLVPALYKLLQDKRIDKFLIVGAALDAISADEFIDRGRSFIPVIDEGIWKKLRSSSYYHQTNFDDPKSFQSLQKFVTTLEHEHQLPGNRLIYLAVPSSLFCRITEGIGQSGLAKKSHDNGFVDGQIWQRIVYEKPFGIDIESAAEINQCINRYFNEHQIYRIDHYLTKELVGSIVLLRFTNMIFEPLWNSKYIESVQIMMSEKLGMEGRGRYYDQYGVLRDIVQNHLMQLLALIAMELPQELNAHYIRDQKSAVLKKVRGVDGLFGQYDGYRSELDVNPHSETATFAALKMEIDTPRWKGVPFYFKTGKALESKDSSIHIKFREVPCKLREKCIYTSDYLKIQIDPEARFSLQLNIKQPGALYEVTPIDLAFSHNYVFGTTTPAAYEVLLERIMAGDQSVAVRFDEIEYSWNIIRGIESLRLPQYPYHQGSLGPQEMNEFNKKYGIRWHV